jgi:hypothetical protein
MSTLTLPGGVKVRNPEVAHIVKIQDFENWLNRGCKSPADTVLKARLGASNKPRRALIQMCWRLII